MRKDSEIVVEHYQLKEKSSSEFTTYKHPIPGELNKYYDDGKCQICKTSGCRTLVREGMPVICYKCYQALRTYKTVLVDTLNLQHRKQLTLKQCKDIVSYMKNYSDAKTGLIVGAAAALFLDEDVSSEETEDFPQNSSFWDTLFNIFSK